MQKRGQDKVKGGQRQIEKWGHDRPKKRPLTGYIQKRANIGQIRGGPKQDKKRATTDLENGAKTGKTGLKTWPTQVQKWGQNRPKK